MSIVIEPAMIDRLLLGVGGQRREVQAFPVLGDVWARYGLAPGQRVDLLVTPTWQTSTGDVARLVATRGLPEADVKRDKRVGAREVAYLQSLVVANLTLTELIVEAIPATAWWDDIVIRWRRKLPAGATDPYPNESDLRRWIGLELLALAHEEELESKPHTLTAERPKRGNDKEADQGDDLRTYHTLDVDKRLTAKLGLLIGVLRAAEQGTSARSARPSRGEKRSSVERIFPAETIIEAGIRGLMLVVERHKLLIRGAGKKSWNRHIFNVSLNRGASPALADSVAAIKADAARSLFSIKCKEIGWAVLDSGIDHTHPAFWDYEEIWREEEEEQRANAGTPQPTDSPAEAGPAPDTADGPSKPDEKDSAPRSHRIRGIFDFRDIRAIMGVEGTKRRALADEIMERTYQAGWSEEEIKARRTEIDRRLREVASDRREGRRVNWARVRMLIERTDPDPASAPPLHPHGTHVAGIIGAHWLDFAEGATPRPSDPVKMDGICPDINLYDFRVLGSTLGDSEFAVIAAMEFIRFLNDQSGYSLIHGANLSLSIPHDVRNYACGQTPVCIEAEALAASGVVVVAAAGNFGFQQYRVADDSLFSSYAPSSITDPGNAEGVITVGATHREWPHTYGVSFFSSRGPTGDGRMKPDLLAPGEKITSCVPGATEDQMDGTSMAAPHVSGAAALLMARHEELRGKPDRVKKILCETATDLGRVQSFQGHGMVDVLRAIQSY